MIALVVVFASANLTLGQDAIRPVGDFGIGFDLGIPQGEFKHNVPEQMAFGGSLHIAFRPGGSPLLLGGDLGYMIYGHDVRREHFSLTIPEVFVRVTTSNNIFMGHLLMRLQPATGVMRPYVEGLFGFKYFWTETKIENEHDPSAEPIAKSVNLSDAAMSYGGGLGLAIVVSDQTEKRVESGEGPVTISIDLRLRYLLGSEAEYLKKGSIQVAGTLIDYDVHRSLTDMLIPHIGVSIAF
jgi:hypothetical protein